MKLKSILTLVIPIFLFLSSIVFMQSEPFGSRTPKEESKNIQGVQKVLSTTGTVIYVDSLNGANDTTVLKSRGYLLYWRGTGTPGSTFWFQGSSIIFSAYDGPPAGYVAANFNSVTGMNDIDDWLVLPRVAGGISAGDSLYFYSRTAVGSTFPDSIRVMYSENDSVPEGTWTELGRFKADASGNWELRGFSAPTGSLNGRFAIRYCVEDGGPSGINSNYIGIDAISIDRGSNTGIEEDKKNTIPENYSLNQNYPNPFNPSTRISYSIPKQGHVNLTIYDILGRKVATLVDEVKSVGNYLIEFDASYLANGVYFYRISVNDFSEVKKMVLMK